MGAENGSGEARWLTLANLITSIRFPLAPLCAFSLLYEWPLAAFAIYWLAVASDLLDGRVARRRGEVSSLGGLLDHSSDALFVAAGLGALAAQGVIPWPLPILVGAAFAQYAADSRALAGRRLRTSELGRLNGIAYFVLLGVPVVRDALGLGWPSALLVSALGWLLVATTLLSMADRAITWTLSRKAPDSPGAGRSGRSPH